MTIKIIPDGPDIELTRSEYERLMQEYSKSFMFYSGPVPTFEEWVRSRKSQVTSENITSRDLLQEYTTNE